MSRLLEVWKCLMVAAAALTWSQLCLSEPLYQEQFRPRYHFSPPQQWMNDPNGMVYFDGEYHLFYQHHPHGNTWGPMHWGHAVSRDMVHWDHLPIALYPDRFGTIFSGSAVVDWNNTSGFGSRNKPPMVAVFTYHDHVAENGGQAGFQSQGIAYSLDRGRTWTKYADNPVLKNPHARDFRDPKVFWYEPQRKWVMTLAVGDQVSFYSSKDLKSWRHESDFGRQWGAHGGVWECPDLVEMKVEGEDARKFVLIVSINPGGPNGGSGTQYFVGDFDGSRFSLDKEMQPKLRSGESGQGTQPALWLDYGTDNYAGVTWSDIPSSDGRRLFLGWMSNWEYAKQVPTQRWRSSMTIPRELKLVRTAQGLALRMTPVRELDALRADRSTFGREHVKEKLDLTGLTGKKGGALELELALNAKDAQRIEVLFKNSNNERTIFRVNRKERRYELDRSASGVTDFSPRFAQLQTMPMQEDTDRVALRMYLDHSSIEVFVNGGAAVFTAVVFPKTAYDTVVLSADDEIELASGALYGLRTIWDGDVGVQR